MKKNLSLFVTLAIAYTNSLAWAVIENPGVPLSAVPVATEFFMPFGDRTANVSSFLNKGDFNGFPTTRFDVSFKHVEINPDKTCGNEGTDESTGWYVYTPHNSDRVYDGTLYSKKGSFHPGEDWNGQSGGSDDLCQPVFPIADGIILAKIFDPGFGHMLFILHKSEGGKLFVSVFTHLYESSPRSIGEIVDTDQSVGRVGTTGASPVPHLHWEIRKETFLETTGAVVKLKEEVDFKPTTWPAALPGDTDNGQSFIAENYCEPSTFISTSGVCVGQLYSFFIDSFKVIKNGVLFFNDTFSNGFPPPSAPNFAFGIPARYIATGTFGPEAGGKLTIDSSGAIVIPPLGGVGSDFLLQAATLLTNRDPADITRGLKSDDTFVVTGIFDLIFPDPELEQYGIMLSDRTLTNIGNDQIELLVRRSPFDGLVRITFLRRNFSTQTLSIITSIPVDPTHDQIALTLSRETTANNLIHASFAYIDGGVMGSTTTFASANTIFNGENFTRAGFRASTRLP